MCDLYASFSSSLHTAMGRNAVIIPQQDPTQTEKLLYLLHTPEKHTKMNYKHTESKTHEETGSCTFRIYC